MGYIANPTLCKSNSRKIRIWCCSYTRAGIIDLLNCEGNIEQINNTLQNIEHIVYKCRQYGVKKIFLSELTRVVIWVHTYWGWLPEQLIKKFNMSIRNICSQPNTRLRLYRSCKHNAKRSLQRWFAPLRQR